MTPPSWQPTWWKSEHTSAWDRLKEALSRDWEQTTKDLHLPGGHELNQGIGDTVAQAAGKKPIPPHDELNPPEVIGGFDEYELPLRYGVGARHAFGKSHPAWGAEVEGKLREERDRGRDATRRGWDDVKSVVRHGYDHGR